MTVQTSTSRVSYTGSGTTGPFSIPFYFLANADIVAKKVLIADGTETSLVLTTDYTLTGAGDSDGGTLTLVATLSSSYRLVIYRDPAILQENRYPRNDPFPAETHEETVDRLTMIGQRLKDRVDRTLRQPEGDSTAMSAIPAKTERADTVLGFDSNGDPMIYDPESAVTSAENVNFLQSGTGATSRTVQSRLRDTIFVKDFGAVGDGVTDDTAAIRAAIAAVKAMGYGGAIYFPRGSYRITSSIVSADLRGVRFIGDMGTLNQNPTISDAANDSRIFWDGANSTDPMFYFGKGHNVTFEHLCFSGMKGSDAAQRAYVGVWVDEAHENYRFYDCKFMLCAIGIRVCSGYNHGTTAWTPGYSAYNGAYNASAAAVGGYASDNGCYTNCSFGYNTIAGISIESAQALDMVSEKCLFIGNAYDVFMPACQGISINVPTFLNTVTTCIFTPASASIGNISVSNAHQEGGASILFECSSSSAALGSGISFDTCGGGDVNIRGTSGTVTIRNSILRTVSMKSANVSLVMEDSTVTSLDKTNALGSGPLLRLNNVTVLTTLTTNALNYDALDLAKITFPSWSDLSKVAQRFSSAGYLPDLILGSVAGNSSANGMEGVTFSATANSISIYGGAYLDEAGNEIATATSGFKLTIFSTGLLLYRFSGASVGSAPTMVAVFSSENTVFGMYVPHMAADSAALGAGTMYYNTGTGKFRILDGGGWRDL